MSLFFRDELGGSNVSMDCIQAKVQIELKKIWITSDKYDANKAAIIANAHVGNALIEIERSGTHPQMCSVSIEYSFRPVKLFMAILCAKTAP